MRISRPMLQDLLALSLQGDIFNMGGSRLSKQISGARRH